MSDAPDRPTADRDDGGGDRDGGAAGGDGPRDLFTTDEIFRRVLSTARNEVGETARATLLGAITAGFAVGVGFLARCQLTAAIADPGADSGGGGPAGYDPGNFGWAGDLLYPIGFVFVILGRYPLFTETTLTPVALALARLASLPDLLRVWALSLAGNLLGATALAGLMVWANLPGGGAAAALAPTYGTHLVEVPFWESFARALLEGWLMAQLVWVAHAARHSIARIVAIFLTLYVSAICGLFHCVVGTAEVAYAVFVGEAAWADFFAAFLLPVVAGNAVGGGVFVAVLNWGQFEEDELPDDADRLGWRRWLTGTSRDESS